MECANLVTGTCMDIYRCLDEDGPMNHVQDSQVSLQHTKEYVYSKECSRDNILLMFEKCKRTKEMARIEEERVLALKREAVETERVQLKPFDDKANSVIDQI